MQFFYGLSPQWFGSHRLFRIYASREMLAGAYIAGQWCDQKMAARQPNTFLRPLVLLALRKREERESFYDNIDPFSSHLANSDSRNFRVSRRQVARTRLDLSPSGWMPFNNGTVEIEFTNGELRRFILVGDQGVDEVHRLMQVFDPTIEVVGDAARSSEQGRRALAVMTSMMFGFGAYFAILTAMEMNPAKRALYAIATAMNIVVGIRVLFNDHISSDHTVADDGIDGP